MVRYHCKGLKLHLPFCCDREDVCVITEPQEYRSFAWLFTTVAMSAREGGWRTTVLLTAISGT